MSFSVLSWIFIWGSTFSAGAACPEANLRVRSEYVPYYFMADTETMSSRTVERGKLRLNYKDVITIPSQYVACNDKGLIDYRRSLMRWSKDANGADQTITSRFDSNPDNADVFFPVTVKGRNDQRTSYLNLITLLNNGLLAEGGDIPKSEKAATKIDSKNEYKLTATDIYGRVCYKIHEPRSGNNYTECKRLIVKGGAKVSPVEVNFTSKNHLKLESEKLHCKDKDGKNACEDIHAVLPKLPRDFMEKYQHTYNERGPSSGLDPQDAFVESHKSFAVWMQTQTGIPASQMLAQIGHETGNGTSVLYQQYQAGVGLSCGSKIYGMNEEIKFHNNDFYIENKDCSIGRPEGGNYYSFSSLEEGFLDWANNFKRPGSYYPGLRQLSEEAKKDGAFNVYEAYAKQGASCVANNKFAIGLKPYAEDGGYLNMIISRMCDLDEGKYKNELRRHPCQVCLQKEWEAQKKEISVRTKVEK